MQTGISVADAMTRRPVTVTPNTSIGECAGMMQEERVGSVVIQEDSKFIGIFTERDMTRKIVAKGISPTKEVKDYMSPGITTISPQTDLHEAMILMRNENIRHLPVVFEGKLLGLITAKDILKLQPDLFEITAQRYALREQERKLNELSE